MECEHDLIRQITSGNRDLFEQIVIQYQNLIYTVCLNIVKNSCDAENIAQETFLTAYCSLSGFHGGDFKSWLCRIAANKAIDFGRKESKLLFSDDFTFLELETHPGMAVDELVEQKEAGERLNQILSAIPDKYASVIRAFYYEQLSVKEIARQRQLPEKTVETQLYRAKKLIRERWGEHEL